MFTISKRSHQRLIMAMAFAAASTATAFANGWILPNNTDPKLLVPNPSAQTDSNKSGSKKTASLPASSGPAKTPSSTGWILNGTAIAVPQKPAPVIKDAAGNVRIIPSDRTIGELFRAATIVVTGFSGQEAKVPKLDPDLTREERQVALASDDLKFIDLDGQSASLSQIDRIGFGFNGDQVERKPYDKLIARDVGQVFGVAIDDEYYPNLYVTASSAFGLQIVGADKDQNLVADRLTKGAADARWMHGQWGSFDGSGPGSVYKVDGYTRQISLFATIENEDRKNSGAALGNIAFDRKHDQLFVSDLESGLIHRLDIEGKIIEAFDHGVEGRKAWKRNPVRFNPLNEVDIKRSDFNTLTPNTWNFAPKERRVWGLAVRGARLFYAVSEGPEVWSIGIDKETGALLDDPRWELTVGDAYQGFDVSDIVFTPGGNMILAQRPAVMPSYDYKTLTEAKTARVLRYAYEAPKDNPETPSVWYEKPEVVPVGFLGEHNNGLGGVDLGPNYDESGYMDWRHCNGSLLSTGQNLRENPELKEHLLAGGNLQLDGIQIAPREIRASDNAPPWMSFHLDYDGKPHDEEIVGHIGDVEVLDCGYGSGFAGQGGRGSDYDDYADQADYSAEDDSWCTQNMVAQGLCSCSIFPGRCVPTQNACLNLDADIMCNKTTGLYELVGNLSSTQNNLFDRIKLEEPSGTLTGFPVTTSYPGYLNVPLSGLAPGQVGQLNLCAFNKAERASNKPYNCCNRTVNFKVPGQACVKELN